MPSTRRRRGGSGGAASSTQPRLGKQVASKLQDVARFGANDESQETALFENDSQMLRNCISSLYRAGSTLRTFRFPTQKIESGLGTEQLWSQLCVLYAPSLKRFEGAGGKFSDEQLLQQFPAAQQGLQPSKKTTTKKSTRATTVNEDSANYDDAEHDEDDNMLNDRLPAFVRKMEHQQRERESMKQKAPRIVGNYAFGTGNDEDEDEEDENAFAADDDVKRQRRNSDNEDDDGRRRRGDRKKGGARAVDDFEDDDDHVFDEDEDLPPGEDKFEDEGDFQLDEENDEEGGDVDEDVDDAEAAYREMYGEGEDDDMPLDPDELADFLKEDDDEDAADEDDEDDGRDGDHRRAAGRTAAGDADDGNQDDDAIFKVTPFDEAENERQSRIAQAEQDRLAGSWEMSGEVAAVDRPRDALLQTDLILEHAMPTAPVITETLTAKLEERLKRRILANQFDDVVRKSSKLVNLDSESNTKVLRQDQRDQEGQKSKASLVDLYEKEYLEKQARAADGTTDGGTAAEPLTALEQDELKALQQWRRISQHLDALSNFFFTPKPAASDLDARVRAVQDQAPAISIESKGMFALSRDKVLAPQDVFRPATATAGRVIETETSRDEMLPHEKRNKRAAHKRAYQAAQDLQEKRKSARQKTKTNNNKTGADAEQQ